MRGKRGEGGGEKKWKCRSTEGGGNDILRIDGQPENYVEKSEKIYMYEKLKENVVSIFP